MEELGTISLFLIWDFIYSTEFLHNRTVRHPQKSECNETLHTCKNQVYTAILNRYIVVNDLTKTPNLIENEYFAIKLNKSWQRNFH